MAKDLKIQDVISDLEKMEQVFQVADERGWEFISTNFDLEIVRIPFLKKYDNGVITQDSVTLAVEDRGTKDEKAYFWKLKPRLLIDYEEEEKRDNFYSEASFRSAFEASYSGWKILSVNMGQAGEYDNIRFTAVDPESNTVKTLSAMAWSDGDKLTWKMVDVIAKKAVEGGIVGKD